MVTLEQIENSYIKWSNSLPQESTLSVIPLLLWDPSYFWQQDSADEIFVAAMPNGPNQKW